MAKRKKDEIKNDQISEDITETTEIFNLSELIKEYQKKGYISKLGNSYRSIIDNYNLLFHSIEDLVNFFEKTEKGIRLKNESDLVRKRERYPFNY